MNKDLKRYGNTQPTELSRLQARSLMDFALIDIAISLLLTRLLCVVCAHWNKKREFRQQNFRSWSINVIEQEHNCSMISC